MVFNFKGTRVEWVAEFQQFAILHALKLFSKCFVVDVDLPYKSRHCALENKY